MRAVRIFGPVPVKAQKAVMVCEWRAIALPRILLRRLLPRTKPERMTIGEKGPNFAILPIVHLGVDGVGARTGRVERKVDEEIGEVRRGDREIGAAKAGLDEFIAGRDLASKQVKPFDVGLGGRMTRARW
eukprot:Plantae.Rhodophyta-Palmaria_palmata.ctg24821.p2 GENE.Plantae.Rhodophyta-Palmaria_palmata.ctg24821~~Plantae.Rhodophyta-Palmaria_palmata.ctg24821.p2  ORF type:complete len:130 (-),score=17.40 Plantae.Rhodophyta-Palmaria_palmata.ctg24821:76-465(-)